MPRALLLLSCALLLLAAQRQRLHGSSHLKLSTGQPARIYLYKNDRPFRLSPVDAILPIRIDLFYRDTPWTSGPKPRTLEVIAHDQSHFFLLDGSGEFDLPPGQYKVYATRGLLYAPAVKEFELRPDETATVELTLRQWTSGGQQWLSGDSHIHLPRTTQDDALFLKWLAAEDLSVGNFLQLQRQVDAAPQYAFGPKGEANSSGYSIRSGQESRSEPYGHIALLGGHELIRPLSVGAMYANAPAAYPFPAKIFEQGRRARALTGFAHFHGSMAHSTLPMDLALGNLDFLEVFQFGKLWTAEWYELLNAGFRVTGVAGSDFPVPLGRSLPWPRWLPLLGPERTLVKGRAGASAFESWAAGVKEGAVTVSNGPIVEISREGNTVRAHAEFFRPLETLEIVRNGEVVAAVRGGGDLTANVPAGDSAWFAARVTAKKEEGEPPIQAHTNPLYVLRDNRPVRVPAARAAYANRWATEIEYYKSANLPFANDTERREFFDAAQRALDILKN